MLWRGLVMLPEPECRNGYTYHQVQEIMGKREDEFLRWMAGQTVMACGGSKCSVAHGMVVYPEDVGRFLSGSGVFD